MWERRFQKCMLKVSNDYWKNYWWFNYSSISIEIKFLNCFQHHYEIFGNHSCYAWLQSFKHLFDYVENMIMLLLNSGEPWLVYQKYSLHQNSIHSGKWRRTSRSQRLIGSGLDTLYPNIIKWKLYLTKGHIY